MDWNQIEGRWKQVKGEVISQWGKLTDDEVDQINGDRQKLVGKIQAAYGKTREQAENEVEDWLKARN